MKDLRPVLAAVCLLAGCALRGVEPAAPQPQTPVDPAIRRAALLYVSDFGTGEVDVYDYSSRKLVNTLKGFAGPYGQCVNAGGNVWIAELHGKEVVEYAHGSKTPLRKLTTVGDPIGCAIDAKSGNLAVANFASLQGRGSIEIWHAARGTPKVYHPSKLYYLWPPAYDSGGNLFVEGQIKNGPFGLSKLPANGTALESVLLSGATIHYAAGAVWDGDYLGVTDQNANGNNETVIYRTKITGTTGKIYGRTHLDDRCDGNHSDVAVPFAVRDGRGRAHAVIGGNLWCPNRFDFWSYPLGGRPARLLPEAPAKPYGESISRVKH